MAMVLGELLDRASAFEDRLASYFAALRDQSQDNGVRLLTYYMSRHRRLQRETLERLEPGVLKNIRGSNIPHDLTFQPETAFHSLQIPPGEMTGVKLLQAAVKYDDTLVAFYRKILAEPLNDDARNALDALVQVEERDIVMMKKMIAMNYF